MEWKCDCCRMKFYVPTYMGFCPFCGSACIELVSEEVDEDDD